MNNFETLKRILNDFKNYIGKPKFYYIIFLSLIVKIIYSCSPLFITKIFSYIEEFVTNNSKIETSKIILLFILWLVYIIFSQLIIAHFNLKLQKSNIDNNSHEINKCKDLLLNMKQEEYLNKKTGSLFKIISRGTTEIGNAIYAFIQNIIPPILALVFIVILLLSVNIKMALITLTIIPIFTILGYKAVNRTKNSQSKLISAQNKFYAELGNYFQNLIHIKALTSEKKIISKLSKSLEICKKENIYFNKSWEFSAELGNLIFHMMYIIVLFAGVFFVKSGEISMSIAFMYFSYIKYLNDPLNSLLNSTKEIQTSLEGAKDFYNEIDNLKLDKDFPNSKELKKVVGKLHFNNISFSYNKGKNVLDKLHFTVNPGEKIAIVGNTGGGKSTIVSLIVRFFEVSSGEILIDDKNIQNFTKSSLRKNIGIVMQDNSLFNTTIEDNLKFAKPNATEKEMIESLKKANADFVFETPDGIKSEIGERGLKLSGGEKQRLCIARVFLKNPKILILDEATSALDNKTEKQIQKTLDELMVGKTTIIIAHRLSTIKNVDKIIVLDKGKIIESGKYDELMNSKGKFYELATAKTEN